MVEPWVCVAVEGLLVKPPDWGSRVVLTSFCGDICGDVIRPKKGTDAEAPARLLSMMVIVFSVLVLPRSGEL